MSYLTITYLTSYLTLPYMLPYVTLQTLPLTSPYLTSWLTFPYKLLYLTLLNLHHTQRLKVRPRRQKVSRTTWYNMVVRHKTCRVVVVWTVGATCVMRHFRLCDQDCEPSNAGPLQKKFVRHNGLTKIHAVWRNLNIFLSFLMLQLREIY